MKQTVRTRTIAMAIICLLSLSISACAGKQTYQEPITGMPFVFIKGGTFSMGSPDRADEQPVHGETTPDFFVGIHEVTFDQYQRFCKEPACKLPDDEGWGRGNRPVINITWNEAKSYADWLSKQSGHTFRLPTEAEWEYMARAGTTSAFWPGDSLKENTANCRNCTDRWPDMTAPAGSFRANPWGVHDTIGNVQEWVLDTYLPTYQQPPPSSRATYAEGSDKKVQRGGSWRYRASDARSTARDYSAANQADSHTGFRLVLVPDQSLPSPVD